MDNEAIIKSKLDFYNHLSNNEKELLNSGVFEKKFYKGESIHSTVSPCFGVLIVKEGRLRVYMLSEEGKDITMYYVEEGEICVMSASCVLKDISFEIFIEADMNAVLIQISASVFSKLKENVYVENFALKAAVNRFSDVMWTVQQIMFYSFEKRLAMFLHDESIKAKSNVLYVTHEQIAKGVGSAREVVTRMLQQFARDKIVALSRAKIEILDKNALLKIFS